MASLLNNNNFETFVPVLFIILFLLLLFLIYAINNLDLRSKLFNLYYCCTCCGRLCFKKKKKKSVIYATSRRSVPPLPMPPPPVRMIPPHLQHPVPSMHMGSGYYEGPTAGYYRVGFSDPRFVHNPYIYDHINPYCNYPPQPAMFMGLGGPGTGVIKLNQLYRSSEDGESFQLPPVTHLNSLSITSETETSSSTTSDKIHRSCSTELTSSMAGNRQNRCASRLNGRAGFYFNNNNYMPSKIMSEHELKNYINYNSRLDANLVQNNQNNLINLRQNFSDVNRLYSSDQVGEGEEATRNENELSTTNNSVVSRVEHKTHHHGRLKKKIFSTSSNLFSGSSFRLSENNYTSLKNHSSPNHADSKHSLFSLDNECRKYDSEPMRLGTSRKSQRSKHNKQQQQPLNSFSFQRQNYLRSISKLRKLSVSMNSLMEKATNLSQIVRMSNGNSIQQQGRRTSTLIEYDRLKDAAVQTASSTTLQPSSKSNEKEILSSNSISHATNSTECSSSGACSSSFSSSQQTNQLIQSNTYGSILGNFGSASMVIQRSHTVHLIDKEKRKKQMRTYSEYNVQAESINKKKTTCEADNESYELPNLVPPSYEHQRAFSTQLVDIDLQV